MISFSCIDVILLALVFVFGYVMGRYKPRLILGAASGSSSSSSLKVGDLVMCRFIFKTGHYGFPANVDGIAYGTIKRINADSTVNTRWHLFYAPYANKRIRRPDYSSVMGDFGDEYRNGIVCPGYKRSADDLIAIKYSVQESTNINYGEDPYGAFSGVESVEEAASIANLFTGLAVFNDTSYNTWVKSFPIKRTIKDAVSQTIQCKPISYSNCLLDAYADDFLNVYHMPVNDTKYKIPCKKIKISFKKKGEDNYIHLSEIQVWSDGKNVASTGTATQSTQSDNAPVTLDGNLNTFNHTLLDSTFELTFPSEIQVDKIVLYNRRDCGICFDRIKKNTMTIFNGSNKQVASVDLATIFTNNYIGVYTKMKLLATNTDWTKRIQQQLPSLNRGDKLVMSITNTLGGTGFYGVLIQNKWTIPLSTGNLVSPQGTIVEQKYSLATASVQGASMGVVVKGMSDWMTYDLIHTVF